MHMQQNGTCEIRNNELHFPGIHLGSTALIEGHIGAVMLFPSSKDQAGHYSYLARAYERTFTVALRRAGLESQANTTIEHGALFFPKDNGQLFEEHSLQVAKIFGSREKYENLKTAKLFTATGKGSLQERIAKRTLCGFCFLHMLHDNCSLSDAISLFIEDATDMAKNDVAYYTQFRGLDHNNIQNNIWPMFRDAAHLWAVYATSNFDDSAHTVVAP